MMEGAFWVGLFVGANVGFLTFALFSVASDRREREGVWRLRSECCDYPVEREVGYRCLKCGHFCKVKEIG